MNIDNHKEFDDLKEEMKKLKEETNQNVKFVSNLEKDIEDNNYTLTNEDNSKINIIKYKFYVCKKQIPWLRGDKAVYYPLPDLPESWFQWTELPKKKQIDFIDLFTGRIICFEDSCSYWKIERYALNQLTDTYYFYTDNVSRLLKNGFEFTLKMDIYLTYTRKILLATGSSINHKPIRYHRMSLTNDMIKKYPDYFNRFTLSLANVEPNIINASNTYSNVVSIPIANFNKDGVDTSRFPNVSGEKMINDSNLKPLNVFEPGNYFIPFGKQYFEHTGVGGVAYGSIQIKTSRSETVELNKVYIDGVSAIQNWNLSPAEEKKFYEIVSKNIYLSNLTSKNGDSSEDIDKNLKHSYFAVFRNGNGTVDCYPIIGKATGYFYLPIASISGSVANSSTNNYTGILRNRIYCGYKETKFEYLLHNDWESIYNDYVKNTPPGYSVNSFIGIYKGIIATGDKSKLSWVIEQNGSEVSATINGTSIRGYVPKIKRMMYQLSYQDFMEITIRDFNNSTNTNEKFKMFKNDDFIDNYIDLLEPFQIGLTEIVPARYMFLADNKGEFEIKQSLMFLDSFYLFLNNSLYNNSTYVVNLGGSLPSSTDRYQKELDVINQQKNAGIASFATGIIGRATSFIPGVGGIIGSRRNLAKAQEQIDIAQSGKVFDSLRFGLGSRDSFYFRNNLLASAINATSSAINSGIGIIGDSINFDNFLKMNELQKRNAGIGYITTNTDDMLSAVINQQNINNDTKSWNTRGLFSCIYKKKFDTITREQYKNYFKLFGFQVDNFFPLSLIEDIINYAKQHTPSGDNIGYIHLDEEWVRMLFNTYVYWDNRIKEAVIQQLSSGIRMINFSSW